MPCLVRLSTLATCGFRARTSLEATYRLSCPSSADTALKPYLTLPSQTVYHFLLDNIDYFWLAKTSNKPISLTTWLAVNPKVGNLDTLVT